MSVKTREQLAKDHYGISLDTLEATPARVLKFVRGVGTNTRIRAIVQQRGYKPAVHGQAWALLQATSGITAPGGAIEAFDPKVAEAIEAVDPHDETIIEVIGASVSPRFPEQASYLLEGLSPATGMAGVLNVRTLLKRMEELDGSASRTSTRKKDQAAMELLAERGITSELRKRLGGFVKEATSAPHVEPVDEASIEAADQAYVRALGDLRAWYDEWSRIAHVAIRRRDHLILLGLAQRKAPTKAGEPEPEKPENDA